jgi:predicted Zn-dependent peptidase
MQHNFFSHSLEKFTLDSGVELLYVAVPFLPVSAVSAWVRAGSRFDPVGKEGLSHFFEHLLMARTHKHPEKTSRLQALESKGIEFNAFTNYEAAHYYHIQTSESLLESLDLFLDGFYGSLFDDKDVEREKEVILDESLRNFSDPSQFLWQLSSRGLWPNSSFGRDFFGNKESLRSICLEDILRFQEKFYSPENTFFVVMGREEFKKDVVRIISERLKKAPKKNFQEKKRNEVFAHPNPAVVDLRKESDQITVGVNYLAPSMKNFEQVLSTDFLRAYLASGWVSKLIQKMRVENDLTYWVNGVLENFYDTGYLRFEFSTAKNRLNEALETIFREIEKVKDNDIEVSDLEVHKTALIASLFRHYMDPKNLLWFYGWPLVLGGETVSLEQYVEHIKNLTSAHVRSLAQDLFQNSKRSVAAIGDIEEKSLADTLSL